MDLGESRLYEIEIWSPTGQRLADISALCFNRSYTLIRNDAEQLTFSVDLFKFEDYCLNALGGTDPKVLLAPYISDIKVKRNGAYLFGAQVVDVSYALLQDQSDPGSAEDASSNYIVTITCTGYLNLLKDRYVTFTDTGVERTTIASDLITATQSQTNGSVGITIGTPFVTGITDTRTYALDNVKSKLQELCALTDGPFDMSFTYNKVFQTYQRIGALRTDISLIYGGPLGNVVAFSLDRSAINLFNKVYGLGSGFGAAQLTSTQFDVVSEVNYYIREQIQQFNTVVLQATLDSNTITAVALAKDILALPVVTITGKEVPANNFISVGDRIPLQVQSHTWLSDINAYYRVEQIVVTIDENDFESSIELTFDSYGFTQGA